MRIPGAIYAGLKAHAMESAPRECCGLLAVDPVCDPETVAYSFRAQNVAEDPVAGYFVEAEEQLWIMRRIAEDGLALAGIYHSHPRAEATLSEEDVLRAYPDVLHVVIGMARGLVTRGWRVSEGRVEAEPLEVVG